MRMAFAGDTKKVNEFMEGLLPRDIKAIMKSSPRKIPHKATVEERKEQSRKIFSKLLSHIPVKSG